MVFNMVVDRFPTFLLMEIQVNIHLPTTYSKSLFLVFTLLVKEVSRLVDQFISA
jgi:hypothetical protein